MDSKRQVFRNLCEGHFVTDFDYINTRYSFQTVFFKRKNRQTREDVYDKIVRCIEETKCPHVEVKSKEYVTETNISDIHIAAALGITEAIICDIGVHGNRTSALFKLEAWVIAAIKGNCPAFLDGSTGAYHTYDGLHKLFAVRAMLSPLRIEMKRLPLLETCVDKLDVGLFKTILLRSISMQHIRDTKIMYNIYELAYEQNSAEIEGALLDHNMIGLKSRIHKHSNMQGAICVLPPIVCDHSELLDSVLQNLSGHCLSEYLKCLLHLVCHELKRHSCQEIIVKQGYADPTLGMAVRDKIEYLLELLYDFKMFREELILSSKKISKHMVGNTTHLYEEVYNYIRTSMKTNLQVPAF